MVERTPYPLNEVHRSYAGPLYHQINELLMERIRSRSWEIGSTLPNETDLAREYGVSVGTMRKALQRLETLGWISRRRGRGTFVSDPQQVLMEKTSHFYKDGQRMFPDQSDYLDIKVAAPSPQEVRQLRLQYDENVLKIAQRQIIDGAVRIYDRITISENLVPGLHERNVMPNQLISAYADYGIVIANTKQSLSPLCADANIAEILDVEVGQALLGIRRTAYTTANAPIELCHRICYLENADYSIDV